MNYKEVKEIIENYRDSCIENNIEDTAEAFDKVLKLIDKEIKKEENKSPKLLPCACGHKRPHIMFFMGSPYMVYRCPKCGIMSKSVKHKSHLNKVWNEMIEMIKEEMRNVK